MIAVRENTVNKPMGS